MAKWTTLRRLSWPERRLLARAGVLLPVVALGLRLLGLRRTQGWLARLFPLRKRSSAEDCAARAANDTARLVAVAARHAVCRATCLPHSLVLWALLRRQGTRVELRVGVRVVEEDRLEAHAWVECGGVPLNDTGNVHERFASFPGDLAPGGAPAP